MEMLRNILALYGALHVIGWALDRIKRLLEPSRFRRTGRTRACNGYNR